VVMVVMAYGARPARSRLIDEIMLELQFRFPKKSFTSFLLAARKEATRMFCTVQS